MELADFYNCAQMAEKAQIQIRSVTKRHKIQQHDFGPASEIAFSSGIKQARRTGKHHQDQNNSATQQMDQLQTTTGASRSTFRSLDQSARSELGQAITLDSTIRPGPLQRFLGSAIEHK